MTLVWEYYKLVQGTYCIIDNIDQAHNSYDQEEPRSKNIQNNGKRGTGGVRRALLEYSCASNSKVSLRYWNIVDLVEGSNDFGIELMTARLYVNP